MQYRRLGRTGLDVSQLGFGAMRLPMTGDGGERRIDREKSTEMFHKAFEAGLNYVDSAVFYCDSDSERALGDALKGRRDKIVVSTKNHDHDDESKWWTNLENSLERLGVECIDVYHHHGINWTKWAEQIEPNTSRWMHKAQDQGLIRHIAFSFHGPQDDLFRLVDTGYASVVTLQYNLLDRQLEEAIAHAHESGMGVVVMGPVAGGRLGGSSDVLQGLAPAGVERLPELALRFVLSNPNVTVALSGMSTLQHVEENLTTTDGTCELSDADRAAIQKELERLKEMSKLYCTGCKYCMPCAAGEVNIPAVFDLYNRGRVYGLWEFAKQRYTQIGKDPWMKGANAAACVGCGICEEKCPQGIEIRKQLQEAHKALSAE